MLHRLVVVVSIGLVLVGCSASDAVDVPTSAIEPQLRIVSSATGDTTVRVDLFRSGLGADRLRLSGGDALSVSVDGGPATSLTLQAGETLDQHYAATLTGVSPGSELVLSLSRVSEASAPETSVVIPPAPVVTAPPAGTSLTAGVDFDVAWDAFADDSIEVRFDVTACVDLHPDEATLLDAIVALPGPLTPGSNGSVEKRFPAAEEVECSADLLVGRVNTAVQLDSAFAGLRGVSRTVREAEPIDLQFAP